MYRYTCLNPIAQVGLDGFGKNYEQVAEMAQADAILMRSANLLETDIPENVQIIARAGAGVNNIPIDQCTEKGIAVFNTPGANANGVKELVIAGLMLASRDIVDGVNWVNTQEGNENVTKAAEKEKKKFAGCEISGKKLGIIGLGAIGVLVANAAAHLGMDVYGYDPYISVDAAWKLSRSIHHINEVNEIYRECDYITVHVPLTDGTRHMINQESIDMMKDGVVILNLARDLLVDEEAVLAAVDEGKVRRYVTDFPTPAMVGKKHVIITPHLGASTAESEDNCAVMAVKELRDYLENGNIRNSVNFPACDMGRCTHESRVAVFHRNVKKMISSFATVLSEVNIANMSNSSRGDYAYTLIDLDTGVTEELLEQLRSIDGVIRVRVVK